MSRILLVGGLAALTVGGGAVAQQVTPTAQPAARMARADTDGDGRLSQSEFVTQRVERLRTADANSDGMIGAEERPGRAKRADRTADRTAAFDRLDANRDGMLSREEFSARPARAAGRAMAQPGEAGPADVGMDGMSGRGAVRTVSLADVEMRAQRAFARLDADRDGYLSAEERPQRGDRGARRAERRATRQARDASPQPMSSE